MIFVLYFCFLLIKIYVSIYTDKHFLERLKCTRLYESGKIYSISGGKLNTFNFIRNILKNILESFVLQ